MACSREPQFVGARRAACAACDFNVAGVCTELKRQRPEKPAIIEIGIQLPRSYCPVGKWDRVATAPPAVYQIQTACRRCGNVLDVVGGLCISCRNGDWIRRNNKKLGVRSRMRPSDRAIADERAVPLKISAIAADDRGIPPGVIVGLVTFGQPHKVYTCVRTLFERYPNARLIVACNGEPRFDASKVDVPSTGSMRVLELPFDCGLARCRNEITRASTEPFILYLEDDFVFDERANLAAMHDILTSSPDIGVVGALHEMHYRAPTKQGMPSGLHYTMQRFMHDLPVLKTPSGSRYRCVEFVSNFAMFRREMLDEFPWAEQCKVGEHIEYYLRQKHSGRWIIAHTMDSQIGHDRPRRTAAYLKHRNRATEVRAAVRKQWANRSTPTQLGNPDPHCVIIATVGRCGSSMLAGVVDRLGFPMFIRPVPTSWQNVRGYFEDETFRQLCRRIRRGDLPATHEVDRWIHHRNCTRPRWGIKAPTLPLVWPQIAGLSWPRRTSVIAIDRSDAEILRSLDRAGWGSTPAGNRRWLNRGRKSLVRFFGDAEQRGWPILECTYDFFLANPTEATQAIAMFLGVSQQSKVAHAADFIEPGLRHFAA